MHVQTWYWQANFGPNCRGLLEAIAAASGVDAAPMERVRSHSSSTALDDKECSHDVIFAVQPMRVAVQPGLLDHAQNASCLENVRSCLIPNDGDTVSGGCSMRALLLGGDSKRMLTELNSRTAKCVVWCATGLDACGQDNDQHLFTTTGYPSQWPEVTVLCMRYGARSAAERMRAAGATNVIWLSMDVLTETNSLSSLLLPFVTDVIHSGKPLGDLVATLNSKFSRSGCDHACGCIPEGSKAALSVPKGAYPIEMLTQPLQENNILNEPFQLQELHVQARDVLMFDHAKSRLCTEDHYLWLEAEDSVQLLRCRSVALEVCRYFIHTTDFATVFWVGTQAHLDQPRRALEQRKGLSMLLWVDTEDGDVLNEIKSWGKIYPGVYVMFSAQAACDEVEDFLEAMEFESLRCPRGGNDVLSSSLHEEVRIMANEAPPGSGVLELCDPATFHEALNAIIVRAVLGEDDAEFETGQMILGVYPDDDG